MSSTTGCVPRIAPPQPRPIAGIPRSLSPGAASPATLAGSSSPTSRTILATCRPPGTGGGTLQATAAAPGAASGLSSLSCRGRRRAVGAGAGSGEAVRPGRLGPGRGRVVRARRRPGRRGRGVTRRPGRAASDRGWTMFGAGGATFGWQRRARLPLDARALSGRRPRLRQAAEIHEAMCTIRALDPISARRSAAHLASGGHLARGGYSLLERAGNGERRA